jgi:hypothetical protein
MVGASDPGGNVARKQKVALKDTPQFAAGIARIVSKAREFEAMHGPDFGIRFIEALIDASGEKLAERATDAPVVTTKEIDLSPITTVELRLVWAYREMSPKMRAAFIVVANSALQANAVRRPLKAVFDEAGITARGPKSKITSIWLTGSASNPSR